MYVRPQVTGSAAAQAGSFYESQGEQITFGSFSPDAHEIIASLPCKTDIVLTETYGGG